MNEKLEPCACGSVSPGHNRAYCTQPCDSELNADLKRWMLDRVREAEARGFEDDRLPATMQMEAVAACWARYLSVHFQGGYARKYWIKQRIAASKAMTFAELRAAIEAIR